MNGAFACWPKNAQDIIYRYRLLPDKGFDYVSPSVQQITGYSPEAYYADPDIHKKIVHPDQHMLFEAMHQAPDTFHDPLILNCTHKDGHEIWLEQHQWPIYNEQHQVVAIEGITRDITERKRVDNQLMQHQQALSMLRERERLAREMHDNLGQVLGYLNLQLQNIGEYITSGHLAMASTFLSNMAKVVHETQSDLGECIVGTKVITQMQADHTEEQGFFTALEQYLVWFEHLYTIKPELQLDPALTDQHLPPVVSMHLLRIIQEALNNIRKYAGVRAARISFARDLDQAVVIIADDGAGFDLSQLSAVTPDTNNSQGYGLHSMRSRAEEIDGHLTIETKPGVGTRVILRFPLHMAEAMVAPHFRLLLVDDNRLFLHAMHKMLTNYHFEVVGTAQDGIEALEQARKLNPDVILMDIEMPRCDGLEATRMIKAEFPEVQIVILTISDDEQNLFEAIKSGASGYLLKSLDVEELCHLLFGLAQDEAPLSPGLAARVLREFARQRKLVHYRAVEEEPPLSRRQIDILTLVAQGYTYKEVGDILGFSDSMIKKDMSSTMKQLHLKNRADAIAYARRKMARGAWSLPGRE
ncbi:MAG: response regulator [Chloroflexaceae bacterium]|nr:response regulator [Chloroflexaceae bacterium]